jgi:hypothetical protein
MKEGKGGCEGRVVVVVDEGAEEDSEVVVSSNKLFTEETNMKMYGQIC